MNSDDLLKDIEKLFEYDDYEEMTYPIIRNYFLYRLGKLVSPSWYERETINQAFSILGSTEWIK